MPVRWGSRYPVGDVGNSNATLYGQPFPTPEIQALWSMWPSVMTVHWYAGLSRFHIVDHEYNVESNMESKDAMSYDCWFRTLNAMETERERKRLARAT